MGQRTWEQEERNMRFGDVGGHRTPEGVNLHRSQLKAQLIGFSDILRGLCILWMVGLKRLSSWLSDAFCSCQPKISVTRSTIINSLLCQKHETVRKHFR